MDKRTKMTLNEARKKGKLEEFIKEHEKDNPGDADKFNTTLESAVKPTSQKKKRQRKK